MPAVTTYSRSAGDAGAGIRVAGLASGRRTKTGAGADEVNGSARAAIDQQSFRLFQCRVGSVG